MTTTKRTTIAWPFMIAAMLVMILAMDIVWWQAILVTFLAAFQVTFTTTETTRYR